MPSTRLLCFLYQGGKNLKLIPIASASFHKQSTLDFLNPLSKVSSSRLPPILPNCWMKRNLPAFLFYLHYEQESENQRSELSPVKAESG